MALVAERLMTAEEFARLPEPRDGGKQELVRGRVVEIAPVGPDHGERATRAASRLLDFTDRSRTGKVRVETGYWLPGAPDHIRAPDVSYVSAARLAGENVLHGAVTQAPDLAVEVTSPSDRDHEVQEKLDDYLAGGVQRVWVVRPELKTVTVHRPGSDAHTYRMGDTLDSDTAGFAEPGFELALEDLFWD